MQTHAGLQEPNKQENLLDTPQTSSTVGLSNSGRIGEFDGLVKLFNHSRNHKHNKRLKNYVKMALKISELANENSKLHLKCKQLKQKLASSSKKAASLQKMQEVNFVLAKENTNLSVKCGQLEKALSSSSPGEIKRSHLKLDQGCGDMVASSTALLAENEALHQLVGEVIRNQCCMLGQAEAFVQDHDVSIDEYKEKIAALILEVQESRLSNEALEEENAMLRAAVYETDDTEDSGKYTSGNPTTKKGIVCHNCEVLKKEIDSLRLNDLVPTKNNLHDVPSLSDTFSLSESSSSETFLSLSLSDSSLDEDSVVGENKFPKAESTNDQRARSPIQQYCVSNDLILSRYYFDDDGLSGLFEIEAESLRERKPWRDK